MTNHVIDDLAHSTVKSTQPSTVPFSLSVVQYKVQYRRPREKVSIQGKYSSKVPYGTVAPGEFGVRGALDLDPP